MTYEVYAQEYLRSLPLEHFMEAKAQAKQRKITLESLDLVSAQRPDIHVYSELLLQYARKGRKRPGQVVPDNMVVVSDEEPQAETSYNLPLESAGPFWVLEYVSRSNPRKDYEDNLRKYERELKVPYYLLFNPDESAMTLYRHNGKKYVAVKPGRHGRYVVAELDIDVALRDGWVRFWYKGKLLPLPADLQRELDEVKRRAVEEKRRADELQRRLADEEKARRAAEDEVARLRAQLAQRDKKR
jgi:Uma2 family endonuclease